MIVQVEEPVDAGGVGPEIRAQLRVQRPIAEDRRDVGGAPERRPRQRVVAACRCTGAGVHHEVELRVDELRVVVESGPCPHEGIVRPRGEREDLRQALEEHLVRAVDGQLPRPRRLAVLGGLGEVGVLQRVPEDLVEREAVGVDLGEGRVPSVDPQTSPRRHRWASSDGTAVAPPGWLCRPGRGLVVLPAARPGLLPNPAHDAGTLAVVPVAGELRRAASTRPRTWAGEEESRRGDLWRWTTT